MALELTITEVAIIFAVGHAIYDIAERIYSRVIRKPILFALCDPYYEVIDGRECYKFLLINNSTRVIPLIR